MNKFELPPKCGIVVIGRNEGGRLSACLQSLKDINAPIIYVDSGSSDNSVAIAVACGIQVLCLDAGRPFSAARARNEGFDELVLSFPSLEFVQFLDGDCVLAEDWLKYAQSAMLSDPLRAAVIGKLHEMNPNKTPYNRLCSLEWKTPSGDLSDFGGFGGISFMRAATFKHIGGFNPEVIAGEDSELGVRLSLAGYRITKLDKDMAFHDANIEEFGQWWRRSIRAGHAIGQRAHLNGNSATRDCVRERRSTWLWGILPPLFSLGLVVPTGGGSLAILGAYLLLFVRVYRFRRSIGDNFFDALFYAKFLILAKFANGLGLLQFYFNRLNDRYLIIEYK